MWWPSWFYKTEDAESYVTDNLKSIQKTSEQIEKELKNAPLEQELTEVAAVKVDIEQNLSSIRRLPLILQTTVQHVGQLRANPTEYLDNPKTLKAVEQDLFTVLSALAAIDVIDIHLKALESSTKSLRASVKALKYQARNLKKFGEDVQSVYDDYVVTRGAPGPSYTGPTGEQFVGEEEYRGTARSKKIRAKQRARKGPKIIRR